SVRLALDDYRNHWPIGGRPMIRLQLIERADIARAMALMAIERATAQPVELRTNSAVRAPIAGIKPRSPQTTNTERKLADLELAVIEGLMTAREADRAFGHKPPGTGGRRRAPGQETFRAGLVGRRAGVAGPPGLHRFG